MHKNRYVRRAKISESKFRQFLRCFALDMEATKIASLSRLNRNTVNRLSRAVRERMAEACEQEQRETRRTTVNGPARRILRTRIGRRGGGRIVSARILSDGGVQVQVDETDSSPDLPLPADPPAPTPGGEDVELGSGGVPDRDSGGVSTPDGPGRLRTLDNFWGQARLRLAKFKGVSRRTYHLHLKECQFRFNHRREDLYALLLRLIRDRPLF